MMTFLRGELNAFQYDKFLTGSFIGNKLTLLGVTLK